MDQRAQIEQAMLAMVEGLETGKTIGPDQVAKDVSKENWRSLLNEVRRIARSLASDDKLAITRKGKKVDPDDFKGVYRIGRADHPA